MEKELFVLLEENGKVIDDEKAQVEFNTNSIDIMLIDEDGYNGYGNKFYSANEAYDFLRNNDCLGE